MILSSQQIKRTDGFVYLYELLDPSNFEIRYVGKTLDPKTRYRKHLTQKNNSYKNKWLKSIHPNKPIMRIIDFCKDSEGNSREISVVKQYREKGIRLTNLTKGGDGGNTFEGRKHTEEAKRKISKANSGTTRYDLADFNKKTKSKKVEQIDPETNKVIASFKTVVEASRTTGCSKTNIAKFCNGNIKPTIKKVGGFWWRYV